MSADASHGDEPRNKQRRPVTAEVWVRRAGVHRFRVRIFDASAEGCKIEFVERPASGERLWVRFDGLEALAATVRWVYGHTGGVQFERPLHEAVFRNVFSPDSDGQV